MPDCRYLPGCIFFNGRMNNMPSTGSLYRRRYCKSDWAQCARFMVCEELGTGAAPDDLFPNDVERAKRVLDKQADRDPGEPAA